MTTPSLILAQRSRDVTELEQLYSEHPDAVLDNPHCPMHLMEANPRLTNPGLPRPLAYKVLEQHEALGILGQLPFAEIEAYVIPPNWFKKLLNHPAEAVRVKALKLRFLDLTKHQFEGFERCEVWYSQVLQVKSAPQALVEEAAKGRFALEHVAPRAWGEVLRHYTMSDLGKGAKHLARSKHQSIQNQLVKTAPLELAQNPHLDAKVAFQILSQGSPEEQQEVRVRIARHNEDEEVLRKVAAYPDTWQALIHNPLCPQDLCLKLLEDYDGPLPTKLPQDLLLKGLGLWKGNSYKELFAATEPHTPLSILEDIAQSGVDRTTRIQAQLRLERYEDLNPTYGMNAEELEGAWRSGAKSSLVVKPESNATPELLQEIALTGSLHWSEVAAHPNASMHLKAALFSLASDKSEGPPVNNTYEALRLKGVSHHFCDDLTARQLRGLTVCDLDAYRLRQCYYEAQDGGRVQSEIAAILEAKNCPGDVHRHAFFHVEPDSELFWIASARCGVVRDDGGHALPYVQDPNLLREWASEYPVKVATNPNTDATGLQAALDACAIGEAQRLDVAALLASHANTSSETLSEIYHKSGQAGLRLKSLRERILGHRRASPELLESAAEADMVNQAMANGRAPLTYMGRSPCLGKLAALICQSQVAELYLDRVSKNRKEKLHALSSAEIADGLLKSSISTLEAFCLPNTPPQVFTAYLGADAYGIALLANPGAPDLAKARALELNPDLQDFSSQGSSWDLCEEDIELFGHVSVQQRYERQWRSTAAVGPETLALAHNIEVPSILRILERAREIPEKLVRHWMEHDSDMVAGAARARIGQPEPEDPIRYCRDPEVLRSWFGRSPTAVLRSRFCPLDLIESALDQENLDTSHLRSIVEARRALPWGLLEKLLETGQVTPGLTRRPDFPEQLWSKVDPQSCSRATQHLLPLEALKSLPENSLTDFSVLRLRQEDTSGAAGSVMVVAPKPGGFWGVIASSAASAIAEKVSGSGSAAGKVLSSAAMDMVPGVSGAAQASVDDIVTTTIQKAMT